MRRTALIFLTALLLTPLCSDAYTQAAWKRFAPEGEPISVLFPGEPRSSVETTDSQHGPYTTHLFSVFDSDVFFIFGYTDYDPSFNFDLKAEINANRDNLIKGVKAKFLNETPIIVAGSKGIEFTAETEDGRYFTSRVFIIGRRPYQLAVATRKGADQTSARKFLESFAVAAKRRAGK